MCFCRGANRCSSKEQLQKAHSGGRLCTCQADKLPCDPRVCACGGDCFNSVKTLEGEMHPPKRVEVVVAQKPPKRKRCFCRGANRCCSKEQLQLAHSGGRLCTCQSGGRACGPRCGCAGDCFNHVLSVEGRVTAPKRVKVVDERPTRKRHPHRRPAMST